MTTTQPGSPTPPANPTDPADHEAITRRLYEYAYGIDTRDWQLYRSIFTERIEVDFSSYNGSKPRTLTADAWTAGLVPLFTGLSATQHSMSNPLVDVNDDGRSARCRMYMQAAHFLNDWPDPEYTIGGYYDNGLVRVESDWRIATVTLIINWRRGDEALMIEAAQRGAAVVGE